MFPHCHKANSSLRALGETHVVKEQEYIASLRGWALIDAQKSNKVCWLPRETSGPGHFPSPSPEWAFLYRLAGNLSCCIEDNPLNKAARPSYREWFRHSEFRSGQVCAFMLWCGCSSCYMYLVGRIGADRRKERKGGQLFYCSNRVQSHHVDLEHELRSLIHCSSFHLKERGSACVRVCMCVAWARTSGSSLFKTFEVLGIFPHQVFLQPHTHTHTHTHTNTRTHSTHRIAEHS